MRFDTPQEVLSVSIAYGNVADALVDTRHIAVVSDARLTEAVTLLETLLQLLAEMGAILRRRYCLLTTQTRSTQRRGFRITWQRTRMSH